MAKADVSNPFRLCETSEVRDRDTGNAVDGIDTVELQRIDDKMKAVGEGFRLCFVWHVTYLPRDLAASLDDLVMVHLRDLFRAVAQLLQHLVGMLAQQRSAGDLRREVGELDRAADGEILAAFLFLDLDDSAAGPQRRIVFDFLHRQDRSAWHLELAQDVD